MKSNQLFCGMDVSKGYVDCCLLCNKEILEDNFQLDDQKEGHQMLESRIEELLKDYDQLIFGVENTGGYERNWVSLLKGISRKHNQVEVYKLNPRGVKHQLQSLLTRTVDDSVSAYGIALYMANHYDILKQNWRNSTQQPSVFADGQMLHSSIQDKIKQRTMKLNQLEKLVYQTFPELLKFSHNSAPQWLLRLLEKYPGAQAVRNAQIRGLSAINGITEAKARQLKALARNSVASVDGPIAETIIKDLCSDIMTMNVSIDKYKELLISLFKENEQVKLLTSMRGVAEWTAVSFLIQLGDPLRFEDTSQLAAFFGTHPTFKQSGDGRYKAKMSKQGSPRMRATLYNIAHNLVMHNPYFKSIYARHKSRGKKHAAVMGILMHKALRVMWGMLKNNTPFDEGVDLKNQQRSVIEEPLVPNFSVKARRYQKITLEAPVSRANAKKRKAIMVPQSLPENENTRSSNYSPVQT